MEIIKNNKSKRLIFSLIWCFFLIRIIKLISFKSENLFILLLDIMSLCIFFGLVIYIGLNFFNKKKISKIIFFIIYPIIGVVAYYVNGYQNDHQENYLIHHFITLSSVILYFSIIQSDRIFDYKFNENLLKISLTYIVFFFVLNVLPAVLVKIYSYESLRITTTSVLKFFGNEIIFHQNINGQSKFLLIVFMLCFFGFKNFLFNKKNISHIFFALSILFVTIIFLAQSRLNILASYVFSIFFLLTIKNLCLRKKLIYLSLILLIPISVFNFYTDISKNRFSDKIFNFNTDKDEIENLVMIQEEYNALLSKMLEINSKDNSKDNLKDNLILFYKDYNFYKNKIIYNKASSVHEEYLFTHHFYKMISDNFNKDGSIKSSLQAGSGSDSKFDKNNKIISLQAKLLKQKRNSYKLFLLNSCSDDMRFIDVLLTGRVCGWQILLNSITLKELILGKGFFADQVFLNPLEKLSSNSFVNIFYNTGVISLSIYLIFLIIFFAKFFKIRNINNKNFYFSLSHYLILYFFFISFF